MKRLVVCLALLLASAGVAAQQRIYTQPELDSLLAPVALYPDSLLHQILGAAAYPHQVAEAAQWSRGNPQLTGDDAVSAVRPFGWHASVAALVAFPEVLQRIADNPKWLEELGDAYRVQEPHVMDTVQQLRQRAEASGGLRSDEYQRVYRDGETIVVEPAYREVVYVRYYDPLVVYGPWWWVGFYPIYWHPWVVHPVHWSWAHHHHHHKHPQKHRPVHAQRPGHTQPHRPGHAQPHKPGHAQPHKPAQVRPTSPAPRASRTPERSWPWSRNNGTPSPAARAQTAQASNFVHQQRQAGAAPQVRQAPAQVRHMPAPAQVRQAPAQVRQAPAQVRHMPAPARFSQPSAPAPRQAQQPQRRG